MGLLLSVAHPRIPGHFLHARRTTALCWGTLWVNEVVDRPRAWIREEWNAPAPSCRRRGSRVDLPNPYRQGPPGTHRALKAPPAILASRTGARKAQITLPMSSKFDDTLP